MIAHVVLIFAIASDVQALQQENQWVGQRVMVVRDGAVLQVRGETQSAAVPLGTILEVSQVNGQWLWFKGQRGWMDQKDVVPFDKAIDYFTATIQSNPSATAYYQRGIAYVAMEDIEKAVADFSEAIKLNPADVAIINDRGNALRSLGRFDEAISDFTKAIDGGVRHPAVYTNRGLAYFDKGDFDRALIEFTAAIKLDNRFAPAWDAGGVTREAMGDFAKAIANYKQAIAVDPNFDRSLNNLAWILATHPDDQIRDGQTAIRYAMKACELTSFTDAGYLDTLAAAYAEVGRFDEAVKRAKEAIEKAAAEQAPAIRERLRLYERKMPYRATRDVRV